MHGPGNQTVKWEWMLLVLHPITHRIFVPFPRNPDLC